jgi:hypothetical protein
MHHRLHYKSTPKQTIKVTGIHELFKKNKKLLPPRKVINKEIDGFG